MIAGPADPVVAIVSEVRLADSGDLDQPQLSDVYPLRLRLREGAGRAEDLVADLGGGAVGAFQICRRKLWRRSARVRGACLLD